MEDPDGYSTKAYHFHCTQPPPLIGNSRFSTRIKLAQGRGRGEGYLQRKGGEIYSIYIFVCIHIFLFFSVGLLRVNHPLFCI